MPLPDAAGIEGWWDMGSEQTDRAARRKLLRLRRALAGSRRVLILMHDNPDPDSLAGGMALLYVLSERFRLDAVITYGGIIGRADNRAMVEKLQIPLWHIESVDPELGDRFVCVDTQPGFINNSLPQGAEVAAVIDHHPIGTEGSVPLLDVRPGYGSVATILTEYVCAAGLAFTAPLATAVAFGIVSETEDLGREASRADVEAYVRVLPHVDHRVLGQLRHPKLERSFYGTLARALHGAYLCGSVVVCHIGPVNNPDEVAQMADFLNSLAGCEWTLCTGESGGRMIVSLRTSDDSADAGRVLERALEGLGNAGGHGMVAGGQIPLGDDAHPAQTRRALAQAVLAQLGYGQDSESEPLLADSSG